MMELQAFVWITGHYPLVFFHHEAHSAATPQPSLGISLARFDKLTALSRVEGKAQSMP